MYAGIAIVSPNVASAFFNAIQKRKQRLEAPIVRNVLGRHQAGISKTGLGPIPEYNLEVGISKTGLGPGPEHGLEAGISKTGRGLGPEHD